MPITWTIAPLEHMAVCVAEGYASGDGRLVMRSGYRTLT
jgi:hypothetical protein